MFLQEPKISEIDSVLCIRERVLAQRPDTRTVGYVIASLRGVASAERKRAELVMKELDSKGILSLGKAVDLLFARLDTASDIYHCEHCEWGKILCDKHKCGSFDLSDTIWLARELAAVL